jgi:hypothetical protein
LRLPAIDAEGAERLAVGDAAASYDPIVARGITKALEAESPPARITDALEDVVAVGRRIAERSDSTGSYSERIAARFRIYAETRAHLYEIERRDWCILNRCTNGRIIGTAVRSTTSCYTALETTGLEIPALWPSVEVKSP